MNRASPEAVAYIVRTAEELRGLAKGSNLEFLAHLLGLVVLEAERTADTLPRPCCAHPTGSPPEKNQPACVV